MRFFLIGVVVFAAAVGLALALSTDPGNVVVFYPPFRIDLSLNLFLLIEVVLFVVLYALIRIAKKTVQMPQRVALYRQRQSEKRASRALRGALQAHFEGRYGHAEREADRSREDDDADQEEAHAIFTACIRSSDSARGSSLALHVACGREALGQRGNLDDGVRAL
ncbi:MAG: heme biosynthesis HemY N-terminal domain-containing protein, partial [Burkholderiaceae bacterium]